jgi:hypothetical protein
LEIGSLTFTGVACAMAALVAINVANTSGPRMRFNMSFSQYVPAIRI